MTETGYNYMVESLCEVEHFLAQENIDKDLILRSLKTAYDPFIYWLNRVKIVQMAFGSVNRLLQTSGSLLMNEQTSSLI